MITKIQSTDYKYNNSINNNYKTTRQENTRIIAPKMQNSNPYINSQLLQKYYISFTGTSKNAKLKYMDFQQFNNDALEINDRAIEVAKKYKHKEASHYHVMYIMINDAIDFLNQNKKEEEFLSGELPNAVSYFSEVFSNELFTNKKYKDDFKKVLLDEKLKIEKKLESLPVKEKNSKKKIRVSEAFYNDVEFIRDFNDRVDNVVSDSDMCNGLFGSKIPEISNFTEDFSMSVFDILAQEKKENDRRMHFETYDKKAEKVLKNLELDTPMFVTYDYEKVDPNNFVPSLIKVFNKNKGKLNPNNTEIVEFNKNATDLYLNKKIRILAKNKDKNYIMLIPNNHILSKNLQVSDSGSMNCVISKEYQEILSNPPKNIKIVLFDSTDNYLKYSSSSFLSGMLSNYGELSIHVLNKDDVYNSFLKGNKTLKKELRMSPSAMETIINVSAKMEGKFPDKSLNLMKKISNYYTGKSEITKKDVENYIKEADYLFKQSNNDSSIEIIFDTGKRLKDIVGKSNTKKEAENVIKQIKSNVMGTKGFIIYSQDGSAGAGRRHTAEVIAGEAKVPFVSINTMDFGTKEVDLFGLSSMSPEASIKKLFSIVAAQAETSPHKSAVLFIENFEYFSVGEMVSQYHQKAMAQLLREMAAAEKKGLNIAVIGSVSDPGLMGEATEKSSRFNDNIEVSSPAINYVERYEILNYFANKNKYKLEGNPEEKEKLLMEFSKFLSGMSFIELKNFMQKAESISIERGHKKITKSDMTEGFMRLITGRVNTQPIAPYEKEIITKHECGHAVTLNVMNILMQKYGKPWSAPDKINFITLDPRGYYLGAMFHSSDDNSEATFESNFTNIVCSYGGHSAEKILFDIDGSSGISADLQMLTKRAKAMVRKFGQGPNTGKINVDNLSGTNSVDLTNNMRSKIEDDINVITRNALLASDMIVEAYADFINQFSDKYSSKIATGDAIIDGDDFRKEFDEWKQKQSPEKQEELNLLDKMLLDIIAQTKKGKLY